MAYTYALTSESKTILRSDGVFLPVDPDNIDYQAYQDWLAQGNTASPVPPIVPLVPQEVSDRQFFQAAAVDGVISQDEALAYVATGTIPALLLGIINQLPADQQFSVKMKVIGSNVFSRNDPSVLALSAALQWTPAQVDALFTLAASL